AARRPKRVTKEELVEGARKLFKRNGKLSSKALDDAPDVPSSWAYYKHFGGVIPVYRLIGCPIASKFLIRKEVDALRLKHSAWIGDQLRANGSTVEHDRQRGILTINKTFTAVLRLARFYKSKVGIHWKIRLHGSLTPDVTVIARLHPDNQRILDY